MTVRGSITEYSRDGIKAIILVIGDPYVSAEREKNFGRADKIGCIDEIKDGMRHLGRSWTEYICMENFLACRRIAI